MVDVSCMSIIAAVSRFGLRACENDESGQRARPTRGIVEDRSHLLGAVAVALQVAMTQIQSAAIRPLRAERHLDFGLKLRIELPVGTDLPQQQDFSRRLPDSYPAPLTFAAVDAAFEPAPAASGFDHHFGQLGVADRVFLG